MAGTLPGGNPGVVGEYLDWQGHSPEEIQAMKEFIKDKEPIDD